MDDPEPTSLARYVIGFLVVGMAWGLTTPFMRAAALKHNPKTRLEFEDPKMSKTKRKLLELWYAVSDLVQRPAYTIPLLLNLSGSALFFLIMGQAELSLTVPIANSLTFLFTVLGEWYVEGKSISKETWIGIGFVLAGITICVYSKTSKS